MTRTESCRLCDDLHDAAEYPELLGVCQDCWHFVQGWLRECGMVIIPVPEPPNV